MDDKGNKRWLDWGDAALDFVDLFDAVFDLGGIFLEIVIRILAQLLMSLFDGF